MNVLIITGGLSPQVVTETVWALANRQPDPFVPGRLIILGTAQSAHLFEQELASPGGKLDDLCSYLGIASLWDRTELQYPRGTDGRPLADIRSNDDAIAFGNLVVEVLARETADARARIHLSLAGGRKTMSFHGGAAMTLFARQGDELSHVLVHPREFEYCKQFWWPTQEDHWITDSAGQRLNARNARVELALVPFVQLRDRLHKSILSEPIDYATHVAHAQAALTPDHLDLELITIERSVRIGDVAQFQLSYAEFALFQLMAEWRSEDRPGAGPEGIGQKHHGWLTLNMLAKPQDQTINPVERFLAILEATYKVGTKAIDSRIDEDSYERKPPFSVPEDEYQIEKNRDYFVPVLSNMRDRIALALKAPSLADHFGAPIDRYLRPRRFGLKADPGRIRIQLESEME